MIAMVCGGCASTRETAEPPTIVDLQVRMAQIRFKQFMVNLAAGASAEIKKELELVPPVRSADVFIDYELPEAPVADARARVPVLVELTWKDANHDPSGAGDLVRATFKKEGMDQPTITRVVSNRECTVVQGYLLVRSTPDTRDAAAAGKSGDLQRLFERLKQDKEPFVLTDDFYDRLSISPYRIDIKPRER
jgi:hypothetical protein